ncbi:MAG: hypothetical protein KAJ93_02300 [Methanosarcinales archaeon]|nr:hypothetical protein [Methanosarcinales archaeon]
MKFEVWRVSTYGDDSKPCDEAIQECTTRTQQKIFESTDEFNDDLSVELWYKTGFNHRLIDGKIARDYNKWIWTVEINSLDELIEFIKRNGEIVMVEDTIAIHDDYL